MTRHNRLLSLIALTLAACGGTANPETDAAVAGDTGPSTLDAGNDAGGSGGVCGDAMAVTLPMGAHSVMGNTTGHTTGLVDFGAGCGGQAAGAQMAEQVIALTMPGTASDRVAVRFTFLNAGTNMMFDTTTQLRTSCADATGAMCFDDSTTANDLRSDGIFSAPGGSTRYLVVSGYRMPGMGYTNVGAWQADFTTFLNPTPPTLTSATATLLDGDYLTIEAMGMDAQSSAAGVLFSFLNAAGTPIGLDLDQMATTPDVTDLGVYDFRPAPTTVAYDGTSRITGWGVFPELLTAPNLRLSVHDGANLMSTEMTIPLVQHTTVQVGVACDVTHPCYVGVDCTGTPTICTIPAAVVTECAAAVALTIATPTTATTSTTSTVSFTTGNGLLEGSCVGTGGMGDEHILSVMVPAGTFDLIAETPDMGEDGPDTLIYDRTDCGDPHTETACNDDRSGAPDPHVIASRVVVQNAVTGPHFIVVDTFDTQTTAMSTVVTVSLRPVLAAAATCDRAGVMNRCAGAACPATGTAVCP